MQNRNAFRRYGIEEYDEYGECFVKVICDEVALKLINEYKELEEEEEIE